MTKTYTPHADGAVTILSSDNPLDVRTMTLTPADLRKLYELTGVDQLARRLGKTTEMYLADLVEITQLRAALAPFAAIYASIPAAERKHGTATVPVDLLRRAYKLIRK